MKLLLNNKWIIGYGLVMALVLFLLKWLELQFVIIDYEFELYISCIAVLFTTLGIWLAHKLARPKKEIVYVEKPVYIDRTTPAEINENAIAESGISKREIEVLKLMAEGLSNQEIAEKLFLSLSTVKSHSSNLFGKLDVKRRTQAIEKAKSMNII